VGGKNAGLPYATGPPVTLLPQKARMHKCSKGECCMTDFINYWFLYCVDVIYWMEAVSGISYEAWNLILFVVLQPLLILIFMVLWLHARFVR
jgi:hypothetical protein